VPALSLSVMGGADAMSLVKAPQEAYLGLAEKGKVICEESSLKVFGQAFMAGCYISFAGLLSLAMSGSMPALADGNPGLHTVIFALLFPLNMLLINLTGGILCSAASATASAAVYEKKANAIDVLRVLAISWLGNLLGSLLFAAFTPWCELNTAITGQVAAALAFQKTSKPFHVTFAKGIGGNWMVSVAVLLAGQAQDFAGKTMAIYLPISALVMVGLEHAPANFYLLLLPIFNGDVSFVEVLVKNWIPSTLGNFVAGVLIFAGSYSFFFGHLGKRTPCEKCKTFTSASPSTGIDLEAFRNEAQDEPDKQPPASENARSLRCWCYHPPST